MQTGFMQFFFNAISTALITHNTKGLFQINPAKYFTKTLINQRNYKQKIYERDFIEFHE